ncbi:MAG: hypothetical protein PUB98_00375 [Clostridiales bacterium]|nr:hypothetical protein [Clostridiales bacterium]
MKKLFTLMTMSLFLFAFAACGKENTAAEDPGASTNTNSAQESILTGTMDEIKDFMFIVTDESGTSYALTFDGAAPTGLDSVAVGDKVKVTYTGELSEIDAFTGTVVSVEKITE